VTAAEIVIDASALLRGLLCEAREAEELVGDIWDGAVQAHAPDLIGPESTHALLRLVRAGRLDVDDARRLADHVERTPLDRHCSLGQASAAFEFAHTTSLSGYDAFYAVLSEMLELPLVTADRKLAAVVDGSVLVA
jgi:predicted nucleic acid-binding protein